MYRSKFLFPAGRSILSFLIPLILFFPISLQSCNLNLLFSISHLFPFWPYLHHSITASLNFLRYPIRLHSHYLPDLTPCRSLNLQTLFLPLRNLQEHLVQAMRRLLRQSSFSLWVQMTLARPAIALYQVQQLSARVAPERSFPFTSLLTPHNFLVYPGIHKGLRAGWSS